MNVTLVSECANLERQGQIYLLPSGLIFCIYSNNHAQIFFIINGANKYWYKCPEDNLPVLSFNIMRFEQVCGTSTAIIDWWLIGSEISLSGCLKSPNVGQIIRLYCIIIFWNYRLSGVFEHAGYVTDNDVLVSSRTVWFAAWFWYLCVSIYKAALFWQLCVWYTVRLA